MTMGRPPLYEDPEDMRHLIDLYFLACKCHQKEDPDLLEGLDTADLLIVNDIDDVIPTVSGLAYLLGMTTKGLRDYDKKDDFCSTVKKAKQRIEMTLEQRLGGHNVVGTIFNLKNNFGWKDKSELEQTGNLNININKMPV